MSLIPFRPSEKYIMIQLAPYFLLIAAALGLSWLWHSFLFALTGLLLIFMTCWQLTYYCSELYIMTDRGLILCRGILSKRICWRSLQDLKQMQREQPALLGRFNLFHLRLGVSGPPAERMTLYGLDISVLRHLLTEMAVTPESRQ